MIKAKAEPAPQPFAIALAARARAIGEAHLAARREAHPWRKARLLWPLFGDN